MMEVAEFDLVWNSMHVLVYCSELKDVSISKKVFTFFFIAFNLHIFVTLSKVVSVINEKLSTPKRKSNRFVYLTGSRNCFCASFV